MWISGFNTEKSFAKRLWLFHSRRMVQPVAIVLHDRVVVSAQLEQKLEQLDYRVTLSGDPAGLVALARELKPLVVLVDVARSERIEVARQLGQDEQTRHIPVVGYAAEVDEVLQTRAGEVGLALMVSDSAILQHLKPLLDRALYIE